MRPRKVLTMLSDFVSSLFVLERTYLFLEHVAWVICVCLASFGVVLRFCMSRRGRCS